MTASLGMSRSSLLLLLFPVMEGVPSTEEAAEVVGTVLPLATTTPEEDMPELELLFRLLCWVREGEEKVSLLGEYE